MKFDTYLTPFSIILNTYRNWVLKPLPEIELGQKMP